MSQVPPSPGLGVALVYSRKALIYLWIVAAIGGLITGLLTKNMQAGLFLGMRLVIFGIVVSGALFLGRWFCQARAERFRPTFLPERGDLAVIISMIGIGIAGTGGDAPTQSALQIGNKIEISGPTLDGGQFDLSQVRGKVVLVDFWATWCPPCVAELPNVKAAYETYHDQGLDVVSVSMDRTRTRLELFLKENPMPWPQIFVDEEGKREWDAPLAKRYGVKAIPCLVLLDREGKILARDTRGPDLDRAVSRALGLSKGESSWTINKTLVPLLSYFLRGFLQAPIPNVLSWGLGLAFAGALVEGGIRRLFRKKESLKEV